MRYLEDPEQAADSARQETDEDIDRQLLAIRQKIAELLPGGGNADGQIDFYYSPLREAWDPANFDEDDVGAGISNLDARPRRRGHAPTRRRRLGHVALRRRARLPRRVLSRALKRVLAQREQVMKRSACAAALRLESACCGWDRELAQL